MGSIVALDVGDVRVGIARADAIARIAAPLTTLQRGKAFWQDLEHLLGEESAEKVIIGLPRNLSGDDTEQTCRVRKFAHELEERIALPWAFQDEALTSQKAEETLRASKKPYSKPDIDAHAAMYILDDYLLTRGVV